MIRWLAERREEGVLHARVGRAGDELVAEWTNLLRMFVRRSGEGVRVELFDENVDPRLVDKTMKGAAKVLIRQLRGELGVHGAAVATAKGACAFVGPSGAGKSTLAAVSCRKHGAFLLADDVIALDEPSPSRWAVLPTENEHWLLPSARRALGLSDAIDEKVPEPAAASPAAVPLRAIYFVERGGEELTMTALGPAAAIALLVPQLLRFVVDEPEAQRAELDRLARLVETTSFYRLRQPDRLDSLDDTARKILES